MSLGSVVEVMRMLRSTRTEQRMLSSRANPSPKRSRFPQGRARPPGAEENRCRQGKPAVLVCLGPVAAVLMNVCAPVDAATPRSLERQAAQARSQLGDIAAIRRRLAEKKDCFRSSLSNYQAVRAAGTTAVGEETLRLNKLGEASSRLQAEVAMFSTDLQARQARLAAEAAKMDEIQAEGRRLAGELGKCRAVFFLTPEICNWGENVARGNGSIRNIPAESERQQRAIDDARKGVDEDIGHLSTSQSALTATLNETASAKQRKDQSDAMIGGAARTIELLNVTLKFYQAGIEDIDLKVRRIDLLLGHPDEDDLEAVDTSIARIRSDQPSTAERSEEPLPADVRASCPG